MSKCAPSLHMARKQSTGRSPPDGLAVYRLDLKLWDMRLDGVAFSFLSALAAGKSLAAAAELAVASPAAESELAEGLGGWLQEWTRKGLISDIIVD